jgi:hypothetical protein
MQVNSTARRDFPDEGSFVSMVGFEAINFVMDFRADRILNTDMFAYLTILSYLTIRSSLAINATWRNNWRGECWRKFPDAWLR